MFANEVNSKAHKMGEDDALDRMKKAFAESHPTFAWDAAMASYQVLANAEDAAILAKLNIGLSDGESNDAEGEDPPTKLGRSEELTGSTNDLTDPPPT